MSVCLFLGPTASRKDLAVPDDWHVLPPVEQGDIYRALSLRPRAIGIVDGYFSGVPSVWHKEILFAMARGIAVFGASSMGALRAAELHPFGMVGVGEIFEAYRDGRLVADDAVAVTHGPADLGYPALSEALVDLVATLDRAVEDGKLDDEERERAAADLKALYYPERSWAVLEQAVGKAVGDDPRTSAFAAWLPDNKVHRKREDAGKLVRHISEYLARDPDAAEFDWHFEATEMWHRGIDRFDTAALERGAASLGDEAARVLEEAALDPDYFDGLRRATFLRLVASRERLRQGAAPANPQVTAEFRNEAGLATEAAFRSWLEENALADTELADLLTDAQATDAMIDAALADNRQALIDTLKISGEYGAIAARRASKSATLETVGQPEPTPAALGMAPGEIVDWYFETRVGMPAPGDLGPWAARYGFGDPETFLTALTREYLASELQRQAGPRSTSR